MADMAAATRQRLQGQASTLVIEYDDAGNASYALDGATAADAPIYVGEPIVGIEQPPFDEIPGTGEVRFVGICHETRCHVYRRAEVPAKGAAK